MTTERPVPPAARVLRPGSPGASTLVLVHPVHGDSRAYQPLADAINARVWIYGIDAAGLDGKASPIDDLERMVERCVALVDELAGEAPVHIGGTSIGGVIAANAAERLAVRGPAFVIDAPAPKESMRRRPTDTVALAELYVRACIFTAGRELAEIALEDGRADEVAEVLAFLHVTPLLDDVPLERQLEVFGASARAYVRHRQAMLSRPILFIESDDEHPQHRKPPSFGWEAVTSRLELASCAGTHYTLLQPPNVSSLAATVTERVLEGTR